MRFQAALPLKLWGDYILPTTYIINRSPSNVLHMKSPYELFHGSSPKLDHMRIIGCLCCAKKPDLHDKFSPKSVPVVLLGYSSTQKGYKLYDLESRNFFISRDVVFKENIFTFKFPKGQFLLSHPDSLTCIPSSSLDTSLPLSDLPSTDMPAYMPTSSSSSSLYPTPSPSTEHAIPSSTASSFPPEERSSPGISLYGSSTNHTSPSNLDLPAPPYIPHHRKSGRTSKPHIWLTDYVHPPLPSTTYSLYPIQQFVSYSHLSVTFQSFLTSFLETLNPLISLKLTKMRDGFRP